MPTDISFELYLNLAFFGVLGLGMVFGFIRGLKKSLYAFIVTVLFYVLFFVTINAAVDFLWSQPIPYLGTGFAYLDPSLQSARTFEEALPMALNLYVGESFDQILTNTEVMALLTSIGKFVVKIIYALIYFTVFQLIYRLIFWIVRLVFFSSKKSKYVSKNRGFGALFGLLNGAVSVYVMLIMLGGLMSVSDSLVSVIESTDQQQTMSFDTTRDDLYQASHSVIELATPIPGMPADVEQSVDFLNDMLTAYETNIVVSTAESVVINRDDEEVAMNVYLFDEVMSMRHKQKQINFRRELSVYAETAGLFLNSDFADTNDLTSLDGQEVRTMFTTLSESDLLATILPVAVEIGADYYDTDLNIDTDALYDINWNSEIMQLGEVAATVLDIIHDAGIDQGTPLEQAVFDATLVESLFDELGQSELTTLAAYVAVEPLLEQAGGTLSLIVTVPDGINWSDEFSAFGSIAGAVVTTGLTINDVQSGDPMAIISLLADLDFTVLMESELVTTALINLFENRSEIEGLDILEIPTDIQWLGDTPDEGELFNILTALNAVADNAADIDFDNLSLQTIADIEDETITAMFESRVLVATLSKQLRQIDLGDTPIIIPDRVFDDDGYLYQSELSALATSAKKLVTDLACDPGDTACEETGFDIEKAFDMEESDIDTLITSDIIWATIGNLVVTNGGSAIVIPLSISETVYEEGTSVSVITRQEIIDVFGAVSSLGLSDIENLDIDPTLLNNLALDSDPDTLDPTKSANIYESAIIHATLSDLLIDLTAGTGSAIVIPYFDSADNDVRLYDDADGLTYISTDELDALLQSVLILDLTDFESIESFDLSLAITHITTLLDSAILHATLSEQVLALDEDGTIHVPYVSETDVPIRLSVGSGSEETEYIAKTEIQHIVEALDVIGIDDVNDFDGNIDIGTIMADEANVAVLLSSSIIQATVSEQIIQLDTDGTIEVPYLADDDETEIRVTRGPSGDETEYVTVAELEDILDALNVLGIDDVDSFSAEFGLSTLAQGDNAQTLVQSSIIQATVSKQILDLDTPTNDVIDVPYVAQDGVTAVRISVGTPGTETETEYIAKTELENIVYGMDALGFTNVDTINDQFDLSILSDDAVVATVLASSIIQATISGQIIQLDTDGTIEVPYLADDDATAIRVEAGPAGQETEYITVAELEDIFDALNVLGIDRMDTFDANFGLSTLAQGDNAQTLVQSSIIQATVSKQILDLDTPANDVIDVPYVAQDGVTTVRITVGTAGTETETEYIAKNELENIVLGMDSLGFSDVDTINDEFDLSLLSDDTVIDTVLASSIIQATISGQVIQLDTDGTVEVPYFADDDTTAIRIETGPDGNKTEYVDRDELDHLLGSLNVLGEGDITQFNGEFDLSTLGQNNNAATVLLSSIIQATVSKTVLDMGPTGSDVIVVPYFEDDDTTRVQITVGDDTEGTQTIYITKQELENTVLALDALGMLNVDSFGGNIDLSVLADDTTSQTVLASSILQATMSEKVITLDGGGAVSVPHTAADDAAIRITVGDAGDNTDTEYVTDHELDAIFDALNVLGLTDVTTFDTTDITLSSFYDEPTRTTVLDSAMLHATISKQLLDLGDSVLWIPQEDVTSQTIRLTAGAGATSTEYVVKDEIHAIVEVLELLEIGTVGGFGGTISLDAFFDDPGDPTHDKTENRNILLASASMHATISKQLIDLGTTTLVVPEKDVDSVTVRLSVGPTGEETDYVTKQEIRSILNALELLNITDINDFSGTIDLSNIYGTANQDVLLSSASMHATISDQILDLDGSALVVPDQDFDEVDVRVPVGTTTYLTKTEVKGLIDGLEVLGITNVSTFDGTVSLDPFFESQDASYDANQTALLSSASMHATITDQISGLGSTVLTVPSEDINEVAVDKTVSGGTYYITRQEIKDMINVLDLLGVGDITDFTGSITLTAFFPSTESAAVANENQNTLLESALMHATVSAQIDDMGATYLTLTKTDVDDTPIETTVDSNHYYYDFEIKHLINAMDVLGVSDITSFAGDFSIASISTGPAQDDLLASALMHATLSDKIFGIGSTNLLVPEKEEDDVTAVRLMAGPAGEQTEFIVKDEIKALITALDTMNYANIDDITGSISLDKFFNDPATLLTSSSIQATVSRSLINDTGGALLIPDDDIRVSPQKTIRIIQTDVTYVESGELIDLITGLEKLGLTDFSTMQFTPTQVFMDNESDYGVILASASLQATISDTLLAGAGDDTTPAGSGLLIVPNVFREAITVAGTAKTHIEQAELEDLIIGLDTFGVTDFSGSLPGGTITSLTDTEIQTILESGSLHVSIDNMLDGNDNLTIPSFVESDLYGMTDITEKTEIRAFITATNTITTSGDITSISFNLASVSSLNATDRGIVLDSAIVRATLTPDIEDLATNHPLDPRPDLLAYETDGVTLTKQSILDVLNHYD